VQPENVEQSKEADDGLRRVLTWTFTALAGAVIFALIAVYVVRRVYEGP
jgi:hypothetical protein